MKKHPTEESKARQRNPFIDDRSLFEKLCDPHNLQAGFKAVKKNGGGPGVNGVTVAEYESRLDEEPTPVGDGWSGLHRLQNRKGKEMACKQSIYNLQYIHD